MSSTRKWLALSLFHPCLARLKITPDALRDFDGFVFGVVGGLHAIDDVALTIGGEVGVQFEHGGAGCNGFGAVNLDLVIVLRMARGTAAMRARPRTRMAGRSRLKKMRSYKWIEDYLSLRSIADGKSQARRKLTRRGMLGPPVHLNYICLLSCCGTSAGL